MWTIKKLLWCNIDNQLNQANAKYIFATKSYNTRLNILFLYYFEGAGRKLLDCCFLSPVRSRITAVDNSGQRENTFTDSSNKPPV